MSAAVRLGFCLACAALTLPAAKKPITLDVVAKPPHTDMGGTPLWAPDGKHFAYYKDKTILLYDVPAKSAKLLINLEPLEAAAVKVPTPERFDWRNRRVQTESLEWSADGREILLEVEGDLFLWHMDSGKWDQLTNTPVAEADPKLSPDGTHVAFRRDSDLYTLDIAAHKETRLTEDGSATLLNGELDWVYPEELDLGTAYWWSPDSSRIAYLQFDISREFEYPQIDLKARRALLELERYPQAGTPNADVRVGVVSKDGGPTRWMDLGETRGHLIARVYWTPDSSAVAVTRLNRVQNELDFLRASASSGASQVLIHETDRFWINVTDNFRFLKNGQFLWSSERDGFRHLYLYSADGKQISRVTEGNWEVESITGVDEAKRRVFYISTEPSPLQRQLWSINLDGTGKTRLTKEDGTHSVSMSPTTDYYLDTWSNRTNPLSRVLHSGDGAEVTMYHEADRQPLEDYEFAPVEIATVKASDGTTLYGKLIKPIGFQAGRKYPAIVMVYGGPGAQTIFDAWYGMGWEQALAQRGFVIWALDNRGSSGRGHAFESVLYRRFGKTELADQKTGLEYLIGQGFVDPARVGLFGWSYGGYMTLYSLLNAPDLFRAGIAGAPVTDWHNYDTIYTERYLGLPEENEEAYKASSDVTHADKLKSRLLIVHNIEDDNVLFQNSLQMSDAFEKADKLFEMVVYAQKSHGVGGPARKHLLELTTEFFEKNLK
jgi:dipeptidyl-peptidase-4